jgi:hypothetical protein
MSRDLRRRRPATRAIAIDWTAWGGIGMATRGSIPKVMEMAGIEMLAPEVGIPTVRRELTAGGTADEIVVGGRLGILAAEWDDTGGLDTEVVARWLAERTPALGLVGRVASAAVYGGLLVTTTLDPAEQPFLHDHQLDGTPLLPGVMGTEAFAEVASVLCPSHAVAAVEDVEFLLPFKFFRMQPATLHLSASARAAGGGDVLVDVALRSSVQPKPELPPQVRLHFRGRVRMTRAARPAPTVAFTPPDGEARLVDRDAIYRVYFHGPAYRVLDHVRFADGTALGVMVHGLPPNTRPDGLASIVAPRLIELCFQAAGIEQVARDGTLGLPTAFDVVRPFRQPHEADGERLYATVARRAGDTRVYDARVVDGRGRVYLELEGYRTVTLPGEVRLDTGGEAAPA